MIKLDPYDIFQGNLYDASDKLEELGNFGYHVGANLLEEVDYIEGLHTDLTIEYRPTFAETYPSILRSVLITSCVTIVELELRGYLGALKDALGLELSSREIAGSLLDRFRTYTSKVANMKVDWSVARWDDIVAVFELRNCIVHTGGSLGDFRGSKVIVALSERRPDVISVSNEGAIVVTELTTAFALSTAENFLQVVYQAAMNLFPRTSPR